MNWKAILNFRWLCIGFLIGSSLATVSVFLILSQLVTREFEMGSIRSIASEQDNKMNSTTDYADVESKIDFASLINSIRSQGQFTRNLILYDYLENASLKEIVTIGRNISGIQPLSLQHQVQAAVVRRLRIADFEQTIEVLSQVTEPNLESLTIETFAEWSKIELEAALQYARGLEVNTRLWALRGIFESSSHLPHSKLSDIAQTLGHDEEADNYFAMRIVEKDIDNPNQKWNEFLATFAGRLEGMSQTQCDVLTEIAVVWIKLDEIEAIQAIKQLPKIGASGMSIIAPILVAVGNESPINALTIAKELGIRNRALLESIVVAIAEQAPQSVFLAVSELEGVGTRRALQRAVVEEWAESNPTGLIEFLNDLPQSLRLWSEEKAFLGLASEDPEFVATKIASIERYSTRKTISLEVVRSWSRIDPLAAFRWSGNEESVAEWKFTLQKTILRELSEVDSDLALELALSQPVPEEAIGLEATVIEGLVDVDLDAALTMLEQARNQPTREASFEAVGTALIDRGRSDEAIQLAKDEPEDFQYSYFDSIGGTWAYLEPSDLFKKIERLPTNKVKENLAVKLASFNSVKGFLTPEQKEALIPYVPSSMHGLLH